MSLFDFALPRLVVPSQSCTRPAEAQACQNANGLQLGIVTERAALAELADDWQALFDRAGKAHHLFQAHSFVDLWARTFVGIEGQENRAGSCKLAIITARRGGRLVLVWPLVERRQLSLRVLSWLGEPVAQYGDILIDPSEPARPLLRAAYDHVRTVLAPDL